MHKLLRHSVFQGAVIGLTTALLAMLLFATGHLDWLERRTWDWRVRLLAAPGPATRSVVTIMIDQTSLDEAKDLFGFSWIWPRQVYAYILDFCERAGARAVIFDMVFTDDSASGVSDDRLFGQAIARGRPFAVALPVGETTGTASRWQEGAANPLPLANRLPGMTPARQERYARPRASFPIPDVTTNATVLGSVISAPDEDAVFRRIPPLRVFDNRVVPALGLAGYLAAHPETPLRLAPGVLHVGEHRIPLDAQGNAILRFRGPTQTHRAFSAAAVLQSEARLQEGGIPPVDPALLKDTYVLLGVTAPGLMDLKPTPVGGTYPGVEVHATFLDNFLSGDFARPVPLPAAGAAMALLGLAAGIVVRAGRRAFVTAAAFPVFLAVPVLAGFAAYPYRLWLPVAPLLVVALLAMIVAAITNYAVEGRQKRFIKGAFRHYLSPAVIDKLMEDPGRLTLGGEEKTLSILFSDLQGFTAISESLSPTALTALLNEYLTAMTDIILEAGGTIDKYEGDAIIAFWNAPLEQADHALRAVQAALRCQARLAAMRADLAARYGSELRVRIGIHTGSVVVGNLGSNQRFDYSFLGDAGNLAARLEGINKQFDSFLLISDTTRAAAGETIRVREIARVRVVGRAAPVTLFEPLSPDATAARPAALDTFAEGLRHYAAGRFQEARGRFASLAGEDAVAARYAARCAAFAQAPPSGWEGILNLTEK